MDTDTDLTSVFLAYQTRFSAMFTSAYKSYLTYLNPIHGMDKTNNNTTTFNMMADVNIHECDSLMAIPT